MIERPKLVKRVCTYEKTERQVSVALVALMCTFNVLTYYNRLQFPNLHVAKIQTLTHQN